MQEDWSNLNRYRADNKKLGKPAPGEHRVVFMGNSITDDWSDLFPEFFKEKPYINRGIGGQTTPQMLLRFRQDVIRLEPDVVVILAGTNDIAGNTGPSTLDMITDNIFSMAELADAHDITVILCSILPVYKYYWRPDLEPAPKITEINNRLIKYAEENGHMYLDYYSSVVDERKGMKPELADDGIHPTVEGYKIMSELAEEVIQRSLSQR